MGKSFIESSKQHFEIEGDSITNDQLKMGCLQRIASATEAMAQNYIRLQEEVKFYRTRLDGELKASRRLCRSNAALRGCLKSLKRRKKK